MQAVDREQHDMIDVAVVIGVRDCRHESAASHDRECDVPEDHVQRPLRLRVEGGAIVRAANDSVVTRAGTAMRDSQDSGAWAAAGAIVFLLARR